MKKIGLILLTAVMLFSAASCKAADQKDSSQAAVPPKPAITQSTPEGIEAEKAVEGPLQLAYEGRITGIRSGVGSKLQEVLAELGKPLELLHFEGASYISYDNMNFMLDRIVEDLTEEAVVIGISVFDGYDIYGAKVGMTASDIKGVLGAPEQEFMESEEEGGMWKLDYNCGEYKLTFYCEDKQSNSTAAYLSRL